MKTTPTELVILKHLWRAGGQSQREIHLAICAELGWSRSSTRKTIERMLAKNMLSMREAHGVNVYRARAKKIPTLAAMIRQFASEVLGLEGPLPVANLVQSQLLSPAELEELDAYLKAHTPDTGGAS